ncbi:MAG: alpha-L-arabinofuranosidase [Firmicutes bacterium]|nr:alpha-L-arabinofuranosidase [Bacillota bacterium]
MGTHEFIDLCRQVGAEPLICVNFMSDGRPEYIKTARGENRSGDAREAADWVSYCNDPDNPERKRNGHELPFNVKLWQIGNETSYHPKGFTREEAILHTIEFAKAMKERDPSIKLIGWGDKGSRGEGLWAPQMLAEAGEYIDYVAIHMMNLRPRRKDSVLNGLNYRNHLEQAQEELTEIYATVEPRLREVVDVVKASKHDIGIAITEGHLSLAPFNTNPILYEWQSAVFHGCMMNLYERYGEYIKVATLADFCGTRWTVNAVMIPVPQNRRRSYLMPVGRVMSLFGRNRGAHAVAVKNSPSGLDISASRTGNRIFLHVVNTSFSSAVVGEFNIPGYRITGGTIYEIAPESPLTYINEDQPDVFTPQEKSLQVDHCVKWSFPAASVSVVVLDVVEDGNSQIYCRTCDVSGPRFTLLSGFASVSLGSAVFEKIFSSHPKTRQEN